MKKHTAVEEVKPSGETNYTHYKRTGKWGLLTLGLGYLLPTSLKMKLFYTPVNTYSAVETAVRQVNILGVPHTKDKLKRIKVK